MINEIQEFIGKEIQRHAEDFGFAFPLEQETIINKIMERFNMNRSEALWQITLFIQENAGPEGDLAVIEKDGQRFFHWRFVEWPSWLPSYVKKPKWHRLPPKEKYTA